MSDVNIVAVLTAKAGREQEVREKLIPVVEASRRDEGNLGYDLFVDQSDPRRFVFVERWASLAAQERHHTQTEHIRRFQEDGMDAVERVDFFMLDRVA